MCVCVRERERHLCCHVQTDESLRERMEEVRKEEEVKRISAAANQAARSAFGKAKWMSFLKGGSKASLLV